MLRYQGGGGDYQPVYKESTKKKNSNRSERKRNRYFGKWDEPNKTELISAIRKLGGARLTSLFSSERQIQRVLRLGELPVPRRKMKLEIFILSK